MENQSEFLSSPKTLFIALFSILFVLKIWKILSKPKLKLPPGPPKLPIIGNIHQFIKNASPDLLRDMAKKYGSIMHFQLGEIHCIVVTCPKVTKEICKTHDIAFSQRPLHTAATILTQGTNDLVFAPYSELWRQLRKFSIIELLSVKRVQQFQSLREEETSCLMKTIAGYSGEPVNLTRMIFDYTCGIVARTVAGNTCGGPSGFKPIAEQVSKGLSTFNIVDLFPSLKFLRMFTGTAYLRGIKKQLDEFAQNIIDEHRAARAKSSDLGQKGDEDNLVDVLLRVQADGELEFELTDGNIQGVLVDLILAGTDSSSTTIQWAMAELVKNPTLMREAQEEVRRVYGKKGMVDESEIHQLNYLKLVIKETLRLHPPSPTIPARECRESCEINGFHIPAKSHLIINAWAMARDPSIWEEPEKFYPERFYTNPADFRGNDFEYIPFGAGRRICPAVAFGIANIELPLACLLYYFNWQLPDGAQVENLNMEKGPGLTMKRKHDLRLVAIPHMPNQKF